MLGLGGKGRTPFFYGFVRNSIRENTSLDPDGSGTTVDPGGIVEQHAEALDVPVGNADAGVSAHLALLGHREGLVVYLYRVGITVIANKIEIPAPDLRRAILFILADDDPDVTVGSCAVGEEDVDGMIYGENTRVGYSVNALGKGSSGFVAVETNGDFAEGCACVADPHWGSETCAKIVEEGILPGTSHLLRC